MSCEFCDILGKGCIVCGGKAPVGLLADPASIHYQDAAGRCRVQPGCGCVYCKPKVECDGNLLTGFWLAVVFAVAFAAGMAGGIWYAVRGG